MFWGISKSDVICEYVLNMPFLDKYVVLKLMCHFWINVSFLDNCHSLNCMINLPLLDVGPIFGLIMSNFWNYVQLWDKFAILG